MEAVCVLCFSSVMKQPQIIVVSKETTVGLGAFLRLLVSTAMTLLKSAAWPFAE